MSGAARVAPGPNAGSTQTNVSPLVFSFEEWEWLPFDENDAAPACFLSHSFKMISGLEATGTNPNGTAYTNASFGAGVKTGYQFYEYDLPDGNGGRVHYSKPAPDEDAEENIVVDANGDDLVLYPSLTDTDGDDQADSYVVAAWVPLFVRIDVNASASAPSVAEAVADGSRIDTIELILDPLATDVGGQ